MARRIKKGGGGGGGIQKSSDQLQTCYIVSYYLESY